MSLLFIDTSALAKRYLIETGSAWVRRVADPLAGHVIVIADVTTVEMLSLLARRAREGVLSAAGLTLLGNVFLTHAETQYLTLSLDKSVLARARALVERHP